MAIAQHPARAVRAVRGRAAEPLRMSAVTYDGRRFRSVEQALEAAGRTPDEAGLDEMDALWEQAKAAEKAGPGA